MASSGNKFTLQIIHGTEKYQCVLDNPQGDPAGGPTLTDLRKEAERLTGVPIPAQKLIYKGKSLNDSFATLKSMGVKEKAKVMLIGKKASLDDDQNMKKMAVVEKEMELGHQKILEIEKEMDGIERGFLAKDLETSAVKKLSQRAVACAEEYTKLLERLDALTLTEAAQEVRNKRKSLVGKIQTALDRCDSLRDQLKTISVKLQA